MDLENERAYVHFHPHMSQYRYVCPMVLVRRLSSTFDRQCDRDRRVVTMTEADLEICDAAVLCGSVRIAMEL